jgi:hypothetical protein
MNDARSPHAVLPVPVPVFTTRMAVAGVASTRITNIVHAANFPAIVSGNRL